MATAETVNEDGTLIERTVTDDNTGRVLARSFYPAPGTPEHDEPRNREALSDQYHAVIARIHTRTDLDPDIKQFVRITHLFMHDDMSGDTTDSEV